MTGSSLFILDGARSPFVRAGEALREFSASDLGRIALMHLFQGREDERRDCERLVLAGEPQGAGAIDPARRLVLRAGLGERVLGTSQGFGHDAGLAGLALLDEMRDSGGSGLFVYGGAASASRKLGLGPEADARQGRALDEAATGLLDDHAGKNLAALGEELAVELGLDRHELDEYAFMSRRRFRMATTWRRAEIVPVVASTEVVHDDRGAAGSEDLAWLGRLKPLFGAGGRTTAGSAQILADGAAMLLLARERALEGRERPLARIAGSAIAAASTRFPAQAALGALRLILDRHGLGLADIDLFEIHETSAADLLAIRAVAASARLWTRFELPGEAPGLIEDERSNVSGGAIAIGHAGAASGARMLLSLARALDDRGLARGLALMAGGGGQATAILLERP